MRLWKKIVLLNIVVVTGLGVLIDLKVRDIVISSMRQDLTRQGITLLRHLSDRVADPLLLGDVYQVKSSFEDLVEQEKEIEYLFVTAVDGGLFAHTFDHGYPPDLLSWNPVSRGNLSIQLLETEKGFVRDVGFKLFPGMEPELHVGLREETVEAALVQTRNMVVGLTLLAILGGSILACFLSRLMTNPIQELVGFAHTLARGRFGDRVRITSRDEVGQLAETFNFLSTELARYQERMRESYKQLCRTETLSALGKLSAGLAHELRNPLSSIKILFQAFKDDPRLTRKDMEVVLHEVERMEEILTRFLKLSRIDEIKPGRLQMRELLDQVLALCRVRMRESGVVVLVEGEPEVPLTGDRVMLEQAFLNLMVNGLEAMPGGGRLVIRYGTGQKGGAWVSVSDSGPGIPEAEQAKIFEPFYTTKPDGTGLGLSMVEHIARLHKGTVTCQSGTNGTTFTMTIGEPS